MILRELKATIEQQKIVSLFDITQRFNIQADLARDMLDRLVKKGCVIRCRKTANCGSKCQQCSELVTELYQWAQPQRKIIPIQPVCSN